MNGYLFIALLVVVVAFPAVIAFFHLRKHGLNLPRYLLCVGAGFIAVVIAGLGQHFLPGPGGSSTGVIIFGLFVRIALVEELAKFLLLLPVLAILDRHPGSEIPDNDKDMGVVAGIGCGLGFAVIESAVYCVGASTFSAALVRAISAAPLHAACGARVGGAAAIIREEKAHAIALFVMAVLIHGIYNFFIINPAFPSVLAILIAFAALGATLLNLGQNK
jgi:RsiW-degrading membrane proteinase PrsW (M82 family)